MEWTIAVCKLKRKSKVGEFNFLRWDLRLSIISQGEAFDLNDTLGELMNTTPLLV